MRYQRFNNDSSAAFLSRIERQQQKVAAQGVDRSIAPFLTAEDLQAILQYPLDHPEVVESLEKGQSVRIAKEDDDKLPRTINISRLSSGEYMFIVDTKSKLASGQKDKDKALLGKGTAGTVKPAWRVDTDKPEEWVNKVSGSRLDKAGKKEISHIDMAYFEAQFSQNIVQNMALNHVPINVSILGQLFCKSNQDKISQFSPRAVSSLHDLLADSKKTISEKQKDKIAADVIWALKIMHSSQLVHQDIKPANILVTYNGKTRTYSAKLADFGVSADLRKREKLALATVGYASPEIILAHSNSQSSHHRYYTDKRYYDYGRTRYNELTKSLSQEEIEKLIQEYSKSNKANDVWALGVSLYVMYFKYFPGDDDPNFINNLKSKPFLAPMLNVDREKRPDMDIVAKDFELSREVDVVKCLKGLRPPLNPITCHETVNELLAIAQQDSPEMTRILISYFRLISDYFTQNESLELALSELKSKFDSLPKDLSDLQVNLSQDDHIMLELYYLVEWMISQSTYQKQSTQLPPFQTDELRRLSEVSAKNIQKIILNSYMVSMNELSTYLSQMQSIFHESQYNGTLTMRSENGSLVISYDCLQQKWIAADVGNSAVGPQILELYQADEVASFIFDSFKAPKEGVVALENIIVRGPQMPDSALDRVMLLKNQLDDHMIQDLSLIPFRVSVSGQTLLMLYAKRKDSANLERLLPLLNKDQINLLDDKGNSALYYAVVHGNRQMVATLAHNGADMDVQDHAGVTPLMLAIKYNRTEIAIDLIEKGANLNLIQLGGGDALRLAIIKGNVAVVESLLKHGVLSDPNPSTNPWSSLYIAATVNNQIILQLMLDNVSVDGFNQPCTSDQSTLLNFAIWQGNTWLVERLIQKGVNLDAANIDGINPLIMAVSSEDLRSVQMLCEHGADVDLNSVPNQNYTPLSYAVCFNAIDIAKTLIASKADPNNCLNPKSKPPLLLALEFGYVDMAMLLIEAGADVNFKHAKTGMEPLMLAVKLNRLDLVEALLNAGAKVHTEKLDYWTMFDLARNTGNQAIIELLNANLPTAQDSKSADVGENAMTNSLMLSKRRLVEQEVSKKNRVDSSKPESGAEKKSSPDVKIKPKRS